MLRNMVTSLFANYLIDDEAEAEKEARKEASDSEKKEAATPQQAKKRKESGPQPRRRTNRLVTTVDKAKALKPLVDKVARLAKKGDRLSLVRAEAILTRGSVARRLFKEVEISGLFQDRDFGFLSMGRIGIRKGDAAVMASVTLITPDYVKASGSRTGGVRRGTEDRRKRVEASRKRQQELKGIE
jgi:large subunit ribosomal protein L17